MLSLSSRRAAAAVAVVGGRSCLVQSLGAGRVVLGSGGAAATSNRAVVGVCVGVRYKSNDNDNDKDDPFGVKYQDGAENLGPKSEMPPRYVRDPISGKLTGETEPEEENDDDHNVSSSSSSTEESQALQRLLAHWGNGDDGDEDETRNLQEDQVARRIRRKSMALNTVGRRVSDVGANDDDDDDDGVSAPLSSHEMEAWQAYDNSTTGTSSPHHDAHSHDLPWTNAHSSSSDNNNNNNKDNSWLEDILPTDLAPPRPLNRREAKPLPKQLLHHNNLALLRRYVTPGGQISNRIQSRLGARDQRKVAKLIKRARHLGLVPFVGQYKYEDHGDVHEKDLGKDRGWERKLEQRGLVIRRDVVETEET